MLSRLHFFFMSVLFRNFAEIIIIRISHDMRKLQALLLLLCLCVTSARAQRELYPKHFDLEEVTLLDGPMKTAMELNIKILLQYDTDRLLTPYVRQSGLGAITDTASPYYQWEKKHPSFPNWGGDAGFNLDGHVGGHYLSALALAYAASKDPGVREKMKERMDYMLRVMKDCQDQFDGNTEGMEGFIGGQPVNEIWTALYKGDIAPFKRRGGWVPFYCEHKILAGLRDAFLYGNSKEAKTLFIKLADWSANVVSNITDTDMYNFNYNFFRFKLCNTLRYCLG